MILTSVALSVWFLIVMNAWSSPSDSGSVCPVEFLGVLHRGLSGSVPGPRRNSWDRSPVLDTLSRESVRSGAGSSW